MGEGTTQPASSCCTLLFVDTDERAHTYDIAGALTTYHLTVLHAAAAVLRRVAQMWATTPQSLLFVLPQSPSWVVETLGGCMTMSADTSWAHSVETVCSKRPRQCSQGGWATAPAHTAPLGAADCKDSGSCLSAGRPAAWAYSNTCIAGCALTLPALYCCVDCACCCRGGEVFTTSGSVVVRPGFAAIMPWKATQADPLPPLSEGQLLTLKDVELTAGKTSVSATGRWRGHGRREGLLGTTYSKLAAVVASTPGHPVWVDCAADLSLAALVTGGGWWMQAGCERPACVCL